MIRAYKDDNTVVCNSLGKIAGVMGDEANSNPYSNIGQRNAWYDGWKEAKLILGLENDVLKAQKAIVK